MRSLYMSLTVNEVTLPTWVFIVFLLSVLPSFTYLEMALGAGFEPTLLESKSSVLPIRRPENISAFRRQNQL